MTSISVCVLSNGDPANIVRTLTPIADFSEEILILDLQNSKDVAERAKDFRARMINSTFDQDLAKVKNDLIREASQEYILFLHSSDVLFRQDMKKLKAFLDKDDADAYLLPVRRYTNQRNVANWKPSVDMEGFSGYTTSKRVLLWKRELAVPFEGKFTGSLIPNLMKVRANLKEVTDTPIHQVGGVFEEVVRKIVEKVLKNSPDDTPSLYRLGKMSLQSNDLEKALECFEKVHKSNPDFKRIEMNLAQVYVMKGEKFKAAELYKAMIDKNEKDITAFHNLGILFRQSGKLDKAELCFKKALALNNSDPRLYKVLALIYEEQGQTEKAKQVADLGFRITKHSELEQLQKRF